MTFAHYDFVRGASIHEHFHAQEEVYEVIEGELEVTVDGVDAVDGVDLNGSARTPARPPPFDTPTLSDLSSSLR